MAECPTGADARRELLIELFRAGLARVEGRRCVREALQGAAPGPVWAAAVGKAAVAMALGARDALGPSLERLLVVSPRGHGLEALAASGAEALESAHPLPDERSLHAGARLLEWLDALPPAVSPLFLISGGASALVEVPMPGVTLEQIVGLSRLGIAEGRDIVALNAERSRCSQIKGGRLAARLGGGRTARALFISDVPGDDPAVIGSGILAPAPGGDAIQREVIASIDAAMDAVSEAAHARGLTVRRASDRFAGDAQRLATRFTHELALGDAQVRIWGGESTVKLPPAPGRGGRNQQMALAAARLIAGYADLALLVAGTDGVDGPTEDAGAVVDGETCGRIAVLGFDPDDSLRRADSGAALAAAGALLRTGPTGTNVADLVIGLKCAPPQAGL